ncbi:AI-2E family transporter [Candidatus Microgenomates bacterium]|nr:AI-2E family transporter [Candidatus Microgenomates bacterium]
MSTKQTTVWEISWSSIVKVAVAIISFYLLLHLFDIILTLFIVLILNAALSPLVDKIKDRLNIPRIMAILLIYLGLLLIFGIIGYMIIPPVVDQIQNISHNLPGYSQKINELFSTFSGNGLLDSSSSIKSASSTLGNVADTIVKSASSFFGGIATLFYILVLTLFLLLEEDGIRKFFVSLMPISQKAYIVEVSKKISDKMGAWVVGQISLMAVVGVATTIILFILQVPYALTLGLIAGLMEVIPTIGPIIAAIPAVILAYLSSPWLAVVVLIAYVIIQQLENQVFVPKIMQKALGISPFITLIALLVGGKLAGILGVLLAVPAVATISVLTKEYPTIKKKL